MTSSSTQNFFLIAWNELLENRLNDIAAKKPELVREIYRQLTDWQKSVENSLTGADYNFETNK